ncbi:hypothetical protein [Cryptosporangium sp. NPDC048952]|uniref:hypothetical protein n=1 Tax=Cryptosporangium sp. NPDC048952 TaxID=3363961 RepID=UPI0037144A03
MSSGMAVSRSVFPAVTWSPAASDVAQRRRAVRVDGCDREHRPDQDGRKFGPQHVDRGLGELPLVERPDPAPDVVPELLVAQERLPRCSGLVPETVELQRSATPELFEVECFAVGEHRFVVLAVQAGRARTGRGVGVPEPAELGDETSAGVAEDQVECAADVAGLVAADRQDRILHAATVVGSPTHRLHGGLRLTASLT